MRFADVHESLEEPLVLPIRGKDYEIQPASGADGLKLQEFMSEIQEIARKSKAGEEIDEESTSLGSADKFEDMEKLSMGEDVREQMFADGVPLKTIKVAGMAAFYWQTLQDDGETAAAYWASGGKAPKPNRAQRRTATPTRQGAATTTRRPASATTTKRKAAGSKSKA